MTEKQLITALVEECRTEQGRVEDFLLALSDLVTETLKKGEPFHLGDIGCLAINPRVARKDKKLRAAVTFQASKAFRKRFNLPAEALQKKGPGICKSCGKRPGKTRIYDECDPCMHARNRRQRSEIRK